MKTAIFISIFLVVAAGILFSHGNVTPQLVDTTGLDNVGEEWLETNPYRGNKLAAEIGSSGYNQNCARCHGLEAISGGIAPDLRKLPTDDTGDIIYMDRVRNGYSQNGAYKMPPFENLLSQEAMWAIREFLFTKAIPE